MEKIGKEDVGVFQNTITQRHGTQWNMNIVPSRHCPSSVAPKTLLAWSIRMAGQLQGRCMRCTTCNNTIPDA